MATAKKAVSKAKKAPQPTKKTSKTAKPAKPAKKAASAKPAPKKASAKPAAAGKKASQGKAAPSKAKPAPAKAKAPAPKPAATKKAPIVKAPAKAPVGKLQVKPVAGKTVAPKPVTAAKAQPAKIIPAGKAPVKSVPQKAAPERPASPVPGFRPVSAKPSLKPGVITRPAPRPESKPVEIKHIKTSVATAVKYEPDFKSVLDDPGQTLLNAPTMRYSDAELAEFKDLIMRKLEAAKKELTYLQGLITRKDEMGGDESENRYMTMEDGSISMEREQLSQMASRQIQFIDHLEKALMRIENKTYGICRVTGKLIDKARLRAVPHATLSIEAKMGRVNKSENVQ